MRDVAASCVPRVSLLLEKCGLENIAQRSSAESYIPDWASFNRDPEPDGTRTHPDSLYIEAIKQST